MGNERAWVVEQLRERLRFYASITELGFDRGPDVVRRPRIEGRSAARFAEKVERESLEAVRNDLGDCTRCALHQGRSHIVFGIGNPQADLMFIGEGPGVEEDRQGLPFVGPAGQLLTKIIEAIDLTREDVYIANVVKCRPPRNRDPEAEEVEACRPFLERQIDAVRPKVICALGRVSALNLLDTNEGISRIRGRTFSFRGAKLVPTFHPAYLLRDPSKKRECWEDMKLIRSLLDERA